MTRWALATLLLVGCSGDESCFDKPTPPECMAYAQQANVCSVDPVCDHGQIIGCSVALCPADAAVDLVVDAEDASRD